MSKETQTSRRAVTEAAGDAAERLERVARGADRAGNVDKIRDILFGREMRDYDKRFTRLEERLLKETADLRDELKRRFAAFEAHLKNELTALADKQKADQTANADALKELGRELKETAKAAERRLAQADEQNAKAQRDLRQQLLDETKRLTDDLEQKNRDLTALIEREVADLRGSAADRLALADLFAEMSLRLKDEFKVPGKR